MNRYIIGLAFLAVAFANQSPSAEYLPPSQDIGFAAPSNEYLAPAFEEQTQLGNDGYRYKTVRRFRNRIRRDVNELPSEQYLPPTEEASAPSVEYLAPAVEEQQTVLADDGYRYRTVRRFRNRNRRDVNELPSTQYLPPTEEASAPSVEYLAPAVEEQQTVLADDGYRYKTVRRFRNRNRRDVNELPSEQYLPPTEEASAPSVEYLAPAVEEQQTVLADDGYRYKTVRRFRNRNRRDVNELPSEQYLPPTQEASAPSVEYLAPAVEEQQTVLADDGYRYKTVRRFRNRNRRDVNELPSEQYLPPTQEASAPSVEYLAPAVEEQQTVLADDGYRYKTVRRFRNRNRRDVNELPSEQYLPPTEEASAPSAEYLAPAVEEQQIVLADDGYRYKTVRRFRNRNRRDVNELPSEQYLPPTEEASAPSVDYLAPAVEEQQTVLADDGYRYKTVRRFRNRNRRDVNELPSSQYLPPTEFASAPSVEYLAPAVDVGTVVGNDGYRYRTVRKFRTRRH